MPSRFHCRSPRILGRWVALLAFCCATGCGPDDRVSKYTAPKDPQDTELPSDAPAMGEDTVRVLGAIAEAGKPGEESWYFFKFQGPTLGDSYPPKAIERHKEAFDAFIQSLKFPPTGTPKWDVPSGWRAVEVKTQFPRIATFRMRKSVTTVDLAISQTGGDLLGNINRWYGQAGVEPIKADEIESKTKVLTVDGRKVWIVDVQGPGPKPGAGMVPPFAK
jgi:hypothetical protein